jgi:hypothetical protein
MKQGITVRLIQPEIQGLVKARRINPQTDELELLVEFKDGAETTERWFDADKLEAVEQA